MRKINLTLRQLEKLANVIGESFETKYGIMRVHNGEMSVTLNVLRTPEMPVLNISDVKSYGFDTVEEMDAYIEKKFVALYDTFKDREFEHYGMDEETWNEWNGIES